MHCSIPYRYGTMVCYSVTEFKYSCLEKRLLFENGVNQILIKHLNLYSVMCYFITACMLSPNFKVADFVMVFNHSLYKSPSNVDGYKEQSHDKINSAHHTFTPLNPLLVGLVVKASASRAADTGFDSCLQRDFFRVESYQ